MALRRPGDVPMREGPEQPGGDHNNSV